MSSDQNNLPVTTRLTFCWRKILAAYTYANVLSHHALGGLFKLLVVAYFLFCGLFLTLRYAVLPNINHYKPDIEQLVTQAIGLPVSIASLNASWDGLFPSLSLDNVVIRDKSGAQELTLPKINATVSWLSVFGVLRLHYLEIDKPDLDVRRDAAGNLYVAGILIPHDGKNDGKGADWVLSQREIVIRGGTIRWNDNLRPAPELLLNGVNLILHNHWQHHQFTLRATPPESLASPIDFRAEFDHPFAHQRSDISRWKGTLYFDLGNTDLAAWNKYVTYPLEVQQGHGSVRAWLDFDHVKVADLTADLTLKNVSLRLRQDLPLLDLEQLNGRISMREDIAPNVEDGNPTFGLNGNTVTLTNFSMRTSDGLVLPRTTISEIYQPGKNGQPDKTGLSASLLDLQTLANIAERLPLSKDQRQMLVDFAPTGQIRNFSAAWRGDYPHVSTYDVKGQFDNLSMKAQAGQVAKPKTAKSPAEAATPAIPGFGNLTGDVTMNDKGGSINIQSNGLQVELPGIFDNPVVNFDKLYAQAAWQFSDKDKVLLKINNLDVLQDALHATLSGSELMSLNKQAAKTPDLADFSGHIDEFDVSKIDHYLPSGADPQFRTWITGALVSGKARDVDIKVKGDLKNFPFHTETPAERPKGEFTVRGKIVDGVLNYAPHVFLKDNKSPFWPLLEDIQGTIAFDRTRMDIYAERAKTHGVALTGVTALIRDMTPPKKNILEIEGNATGPLAEFVGYTRDSAVQDMIGGFTNDTRASGNAKLNLKLQLPLSDLPHSKVQGKLQFANDEVDLFPGLPRLSETTGLLEFSEKGLNLSGIHASFLGGPVTLNGGGPADSAVIKVDGTLTADGLHKFATAGAQQLAKRITGNTHYNVGINIRKSHTDVVVESSLQGMGIDLPVPLHKESNESLPVKLEIVGTSPVDAAVAREEIKVAVGPAIVARYLREKSPDRNVSWRLLSGAIAVNTPSVPPASGVLLNVNMKTLNADTWLDLISSFSVPAADKGNADNADSVGFAEFVSPDILVAHANDMIIFKRKLDKVALDATLHKDVWQANINSSQVAGDISYAAKADQGKGRVTARLSSLIIPEEAATQVAELLDGKNSTSDLPSLDLQAANFDLFGKHFGKLVLEANNIRSASSNDWQIKTLSLVNPDATLNVTKGDWISKDGNNRSSLTYSLDIVDAGLLLERLGFPGVLSGGSGKMEGEVDWNGVPYALDTSSLSGKIQMDVAKGQFLKQSAGAAKLLGVLSLQSLPRRLTLDFRDVFSEGFAFDGVTMTAAINKGVVSTDNLKMHGVDATVLMTGSADIANETQNLHVIVIPELDAGAASVLYALAVNPIIGAGSFLAQLFLRAPLAKALTHEYEITGPWKEPVVNKLERKVENVSQNPQSNNK